MRGIQKLDLEASTKTKFVFKGIMHVADAAACFNPLKAKLRLRYLNT